MPKDDRILNIVRVGDVITYSSLAAIARQTEESLDGIVTRCNVGHHNAPVMPAIDAYFLTQVIGSEYKGWTIGITSADLTTSDEDAVFGVVLGGKNPKTDVAVVSTSRLSPPKLSTEDEYQLLLSRLQKVTLHEVGHILGLTDHRSMVFSGDGKMCPMSRGGLDLGYHGYVNLIVDGRGMNYCSGCTDFLRLRLS